MLPHNQRMKSFAALTATRLPPRALCERYTKKKESALSTRDRTGLEIMHAMAQGEIPHPSIAETIPMKCILAEKGKIVFEVKADGRHLNPLGGIHGGFAATVMDSVTGCVVHTMLDAGVGYATVDLNVKMLKPVPRDIMLIAEGLIIKISASLGVSEGTLKDENGKLYAHSTATCMIFRG